MIEVFKTDVVSTLVARSLSSGLAAITPSASVTFDLDDRDRILRIEAPELNIDLIIQYLESQAVLCSILT